MGASYRGMTGRVLDDAYATRRLAPDCEAILARQAREGEAVVREHRPLHLDYGNETDNTPDTCLDLFVPEGEGPWPLVAFIHGGYWQRLDHTAVNFMAPRFLERGMLERGMAFASLGYSVAPHASIDEMIVHCMRGLHAILEQAPSLNLSGEIHLGGHSAGAQLAAMVPLAGARLSGLPAVPLRSLLLVSGVFDLEPIAKCFVNDALGLDVAEARALSPMFQLNPELPATQILYAERDTFEFHRQSLAFAAELAGLGVAVRAACVEDCDHFDILDELGRADSVALRWVR
ncbi:arylformamidase [Modicisalibacter muralis]|uniref:Arylformamidase n=1 Tax=Modicisalibacter muralis TaxID=119000 RepID=A0A1G9GTX3_9GAMM|nr:alpha/beta hydrolase [Halomonas muralis]SDL04126.1 arylformamidase [Halomonas muralis]